SCAVNSLQSLFWAPCFPLPYYTALRGVKPGKSAGTGAGRRNEGLIMAFSLIHNFRKYQKFWMASILLLCMITFVLCTGVGGDLRDFIISASAGRGGTEVPTVKVYRVYEKDLRDLQPRRNLADVYMREATRFAIAQMEGKLKNIDKLPVPP